MKPNFTSITIIADESGSMLGLREDTINSVNSFIKEQKDVPGEAMFSLCVFNTTNRFVYDFVPLDTVKDISYLDYNPAGSTALLDALGSTIDNLGKKLAETKEEDRPSKVLILVITDGQENASHKYSSKKIKEMVEHQKSVYSWEFVFSAANIDSFKEGGALGFSSNNIMNYDSDARGTHNLYRTISEKTTKYRTSNSTNSFFNK